VKKMKVLCENSKVLMIITHMIITVE